MPPRCQPAEPPPELLTPGTARAASSTASAASVSSPADGIDASRRSRSGNGLRQALGIGEAGIGVLRRDAGHGDGPLGKLGRIGEDVGGDGREAAADKDAEGEIVALGAAGLLDLAEAHLDGERHAADADRVGRIGAGLAGGLDEADGAVGEVFLVEDGGHLAGGLFAGLIVWIAGRPRQASRRR